MLSGYRVLDLSGEHGIVCGFVFAELGADVISIEPPGGSTARHRGPFADHVRDPESSLFWWGYARNRRSVSLDPESQSDREALLRLVASADVFIESGRPGELARLGLGYDDLRAVHPALIYVSVTPFGQTGPKANWAATDLTIMAAGAPLLLYGDADRPPVRSSIPQAFPHAAADAAVAALIALHERNRSGLGQHVDVSAQQSVALLTQGDIVAAAIGSRGAQRSAGGARFGKMLLRFVYPTIDGHVSITFSFGSAIGKASARLMEVVCEEGFCDTILRDKDWVAMTELIVSKKEPLETFERAKSAIAAWTASKTKEELLALAMKRGLLIAPVSTTRDVTESSQLAARDYFQVLDRPDGRGHARQLGRFALFGVGPQSSRCPARPAPRIGEHTAEVLDTPPNLENRSFSDSTPVSVPTPTTDATQEKSLPLAGVKILDFMWAIAGPMATRILADYGAEVIRVESTTRPDACRTMQPFIDRKPNVDSATLFHNANANKTMLTIDLSNPAAKEVIFDLVRWADIVCESFSPGTLARLGFGYDTLREIDPSIIMLSTSLMGQSGPLAHFAGYGNLAAAISGFNELVGWPDRAAAGPYNAYTDYIAPKFNAAALLAALEHRRRTGDGQWIDLSQAEAALHFLAPALLDTLVNDHVFTRSGNRDERMAPHGCYAVAGEDKWIAIAVEDDLGFHALCKELGRAELTEELRFKTMKDRLDNAEALDSALAELTSSRDGDDLEAALQRAGVACHCLLDSAAAFKDSQLSARGHFVSLASAELNSIIEDTRSKLSRTPAQIRGGLPTLGRDNFEVLSRVLGYAEEHTAELAITGVLG